MAINSIEEAFEAIEKRQEQIPFEAIEFLYEHEQCAQITEKIAFSLKNAYNDAVFYDEQPSSSSSVPLWYAAVAENHLSEALINPIIELYTSKNIADWNYLDEQGCFLIGKASAVIGRPAIKAFLDTIEFFAKKDTKLPIIYFHECVHFVDHEEDLPQILRILQCKDYYSMDSLTTHLAQAQVKGTLPQLKEILKYYKNEPPSFLFSFQVTELEEAVQELETGVSPFPESVRPFYQTRGNWKEAYKQYYKEDKSNVILPAPPPKKEKN